MSETDLTNKILYDGSKTLIELYDEIKDLHIFNFFDTIYNMISYYLELIPDFIIDDEDTKTISVDYSKYYPEQNWKENSNGLYVLIHGLLSSPKFKGRKFVKEINKKGHNYDILLPNLIDSGNNSLDIITEPLYILINDYINKNPGKPIHLIANSNGCRVASLIEIKLRDLDVNMKITSIAGAYNGSSNIDRFPHILDIFLKETVINELSTNSEVNMNLIKLMNDTPIKGKRFYDFYCTLNDWYIPNIDDCYPKLKNHENLTIKYNDVNFGYDHVGLSWYLSKEIISSDNWMENNEKF